MKVSNNKLNGREEEVLHDKFSQAEQFLSNEYDFRYNTITDSLEMRIVGSEEYETANTYQIYIDTQKSGIKISHSDIEAIMASDFVERYNPIQEYFEKLQWDGHDWLSQLCTFIDVPDTERFKLNMTKMLIRSVACALDSKVVNKQILVFVSEAQNTGKSTFVRWLCPPALKDYFTENVNFNDKDTNIAFCENFIINIDELAALHKTDINRLKAAISKADDKSRRAYARRQLRRIRIANFFGTTNNIEFLTDETGNVRFVCFIVNNINFKYSEQLAIDQIWAQAYTHYKQGHPYELTAHEIRDNELANNTFRKRTAEMELISRYFLPGDKDNYDVFMRATDFKSAFHHLDFVRGSFNPEIIGKALKTLQFSRMTKYSKPDNSDKGFSEYGYFVKVRDDVDGRIKEILSIYKIGIY